ncbi:integrase, catalytic region, zinc finger, CCHC-type containing protein [Tanacetum coccineum]
MQQPLPNNNFIAQPSFNTNYMQQPMPNPKDIIDPTTVINMALVLMAKAFKLNYSTLTNNNQIKSSNPRNRKIAQPAQNVGNQIVRNVVQNPGVQNVGNQNGLIVVSRIANQNAHQNGNCSVVAAQADGNGNGNNKNQIRCYNCRGMGHLARNCTVRPKRRDVAYLQTQLLIAQKEEAKIQFQAEEFDLMDATGDLDKIEEVNANYILMANLQQASISRTQTDKAPVYDLDGSAELHEYDNCYNNEIFNMFIQEEQYTELLNPISELHQDIMSIVQNPTVVETSDLQTELERTKERIENCIVIKANEYAKLWNDWYKKCKECKYDKISYDKAYNDMQQKIELLQAQLGDLKGKSKDTLCVSNTLDPLFQKLKNENVELEF